MSTQPDKTAPGFCLLPTLFALQKRQLPRTVSALPCMYVCLCAPDYSKIVARTDGYSGSDMRNLIQEACQGPVRSAVAEHGEAVAGLRDADLRAVSCAEVRLENPALLH